MDKTFNGVLANINRCGTKHVSKDGLRIYPCAPGRIAFQVRVKAKGENKNANYAHIEVAREDIAAIIEQLKTFVD